MSYEYAKLGNTCRTSMRVLLSNTKFISENDPIYRESVKLSIPLRMDKKNSKEENGDKEEVLKEPREPREPIQSREPIESTLPVKLLLNRNPSLNPRP